MTVHRNHAPLRATVAVVAMLSVACGGGDGADDTANTVVSSTGAPSTTETPTTTSTSTPVADTTSTTSTTTSTSTTTTTTTIQPPEVSVPSVAAGDIPALVSAWGAGTTAPLTLARQLIGFPIDVDVPTGATAHAISVDMFGADPDSAWSWDWTYVALAVEPIGDIDTELEDGGPGTITTRLTYDEIMGALGWRNTGEVISDPSSGAGGPKSVNFVYQPEFDRYSVGGVPTTPVVVRVWAEEDVIFGGDRESGYQIDVTLESPTGEVLVPLVEALYSDLPLAPNDLLTRVRVRSGERAADSFDADKGLRFIDVEFEIDLGDTVEEAQLRLSTGLSGTIYQIGDENFFEEGFIEVTEPTVDGDTWTQKVVVLDRYLGTISVFSDPTGGSPSAAISLRLEANPTVLEPPISAS